MICIGILRTVLCCTLQFQSRHHRRNKTLNTTKKGPVRTKKNDSTKGMPLKDGSKICSVRILQCFNVAILQCNAVMRQPHSHSSHIQLPPRDPEIRRDDNDNDNAMPVSLCLSPLLYPNEEEVLDLFHSRRKAGEGKDYPQHDHLMVRQRRRGIGDKVANEVHFLFLPRFSAVPCPFPTR